MKPSILNFFTLLAAAIMLFESCEKVEEPDVQIVKEVLNIGLIITDAFEISESFVPGDAYPSELPECIKQTESTEDMFLLSFENCEYKGITRQGEILVYLNILTDTLQSRQIVFQNYAVNHNLITGSIDVRFEIRELDSCFYLIEAKNIQYIFPDGSYLSTQLDFECEMTAGFHTPHSPSDDEYEISGKSYGISSQGDFYSAEYYELIQKGGCRLPVSGTADIYKRNADPIKIDFDQYGSSGCDNKVRIRQNGITTDINL